MSWLLDTNVISEMMRPHPEPRAARFLDRIASRRMAFVTRNTRDFRNTGVRVVNAWNPGQDEN